MHLLELTRSSLAENLACDEALLQLTNADPTTGILRLWESPEPAVIVGRSNRIETEVETARCATDAVPVLRRCSGGGTVVIGPGCLMYSLVLPITEDEQLLGIRGTTEKILRTIANGLSRSLPGIDVRGISDLVWNGKKFSGNSQRWLRRALLHHGTLLYDYDLSKVSRWLRMPTLQPEYRATRPHAEFITNLPLTAAELRAGLIHSWRAETPFSPTGLDDTIEQMLQSRYGKPDWHTER